MTGTVGRGWLLAALVLAVALLVASIALAVPAIERSSGAAQGWHETRTGSSMMGRADWDRSDARGRVDPGEDCRDLMRGREGR